MHSRVYHIFFLSFESICGFFGEFRVDREAANSRYLFIYFILFLITAAVAEFDNMHTTARFV